ncbi:MAG: DUF5606 domain-containing protein [Saprospiraceae bacterium]|nr:DUF5606 domain-containing protein [Saprospiraceae bacterium]
MDIEKYVSVSGLPGLYRIVSNRSNGLVIEDLDNGKAKFASVRQYQFNPIASIGIYVDGEEETVSLSDVFTSMLEKIDTVALPGGKASNDELMDYLAEVLPAFDRERVYPSDVKRLVKWFSFLNERNLLSLEEAAEEETKEENTEEK